MYLPFIEGDETCAPVWIRRMLEAVPCPKDKRRSTALFCNPDLSPFKPALADSLFEDITKRQLGAAVADTVSLHSGRVFLACALLASDAGDPLTKAMIRWKTDASCHIYGRLNPANYAAWLRRAAQATTTAQQVTTLRQRNLYGDNDEAHVTLGDVVTQLAHANVEDTCEPASDSDDDAAAAAPPRPPSPRARPPRLGDDARLEVQQANPKLVGSKSYERYELYKAATTKGEFRALGGTAADLLHDIKHGFAVLVGASPR